MDTRGLSHLANYDFDQPGRHVPRHIGLQALLVIQHLRGHDLRAPSAGLIVLQVTCQSMRVQDVHKEIFVVGHVGHRLDVINMGML